MEFLGQNGWPAPRLKDVELTKKSYNRIYLRLVHLLRDMYQKCRLVHGDLSEYNLLYYNKDVWIIDVSQSVEIDHPNALHFLRSDCKNVTDYFAKYLDHHLGNDQKWSGGDGYQGVVRLRHTPHPAGERIRQLHRASRHGDAHER